MRNPFTAPAFGFPRSPPCALPEAESGSRGGIAHRCECPALARLLRTEAGTLPRETPAVLRQRASKCDSFLNRTIIPSPCRLRRANPSQLTTLGWRQSPRGKNPSLIGTARRNSLNHRIFSASQVTCSGSELSQITEKQRRRTDHRGEVFLQIRRRSAQIADQHGLNRNGHGAMVEQRAHLARAGRSWWKRHPRCSSSRDRRRRAARSR